MFSPSPFRERAGERGSTLDELAAYQLLVPLGIGHARAEAVDANLPRTTLPFPVAVKALSADLPHKTDAGGVVLGVADERALIQAVTRIREGLARHHPGVLLERVLVQSMAPGLGEALVGFRRDAQVGPIVMLAAGGILAEVYRDRAIRLAPVDLDEARAMVAEVKAFAALAGHRGRPRGDLEALAAAVAALSRLALQDEPVVLEAELNPVMVLAQGEGVVAVDALARIA